MADNLEVALRRWEVEVSLKKSEKFKQNMGKFLERKGFVKGEKYWENAAIGGLRLYSTCKHTGCGTETILLSITSHFRIGRLPPVINLIEQEIYNQEYNSFKIIPGLDIPKF
ncbi:MAG: hypothetical protein NTW17_00995 [Candidatus Pacearchaeota archaeon]|nr:hypothetical protein [Candidatus Pacearchaeota archaeon]